MNGSNEIGDPLESALRFHTRVERQERNWGAWILVSLVLHLVVLLFLWKFGLLDRPQNPSSNAVSTRVISPQELDRILHERDWVRSKKSEEKIAPKERAQFEGERTQRTRRQTQVDRMGSVEGTARESKILIGKSAVDIKDLGLGPGAKLPNDPNAEGEVQKGSFDQLGREVVAGAETILNTDEFRYMSFHNRAVEAIGSRWLPRIRAIVYDPTRKLPPSTYTTYTQVTFDKEGNIMRVEILQGSGQSDIDNAARDAILQTVRIQNPPEALRDPDGLYRMRFGFILLLESSGLKMEYVPDPRLRNP